MRDLARAVSPLGDVRVVEDLGPTPHGFRDINYHWPPGGSVVHAWDRAFHGIDLQTTWFVEDDVAGRRSDFQKLHEATCNEDADLLSLYIESREQAPTWPHWHNNRAYPAQFKSFNPLCRLSPELIRRVIELRERKGHFLFHEVMFPSLARTRLDMRDLLPGMFDSFQWRPQVRTVMPGICHPVKDPSVRSAFLDNPF